MDEKKVESGNDTHSRFQNQIQELKGVSRMIRENVLHKMLKHTKTLRLVTSFRLRRQASWRNLCIRITGVVGERVVSFGRLQYIAFEVVDATS